MRNAVHPLRSEAPNGVNTGKQYGISTTSMRNYTGSSLKPGDPTLGEQMVSIKWRSYTMFKFMHRKSGFWIAAKKFSIYGEKQGLKYFDKKRIRHFGRNLPEWLILKNSSHYRHAIATFDKVISVP
jgi:hypothetical protein